MCCLAFHRQRRERGMAAAARKAPDIFHETPNGNHSFPGRSSCVYGPRTRALRYGGWGGVVTAARTRRGRGGKGINRGGTSRWVNNTPFNVIHLYTRTVQVVYMYSVRTASWIPKNTVVHSELMGKYPLLVRSSNTNLIIIYRID